MGNIELKKLQWVQETDINWRLETIDGDMLCKIVKSKFKAFVVYISHKVNDVYAESPFKCDTLIDAQNEFINVYSDRLGIFFYVEEVADLILESILNPFEEEVVDNEIEVEVIDVKLGNDFDEDSDDEDDFNEPIYDVEEEAREEYDDYLNEESKKYVDETPYGDSTDSYYEEEDDQYSGDDSDDD